MPAAALPADEARRLRVLRTTGVLDSAPEESFNALVRCAALITECPISLVSLVDERRQWFKAAHGLLLSETPRDLSFCAHAIHHDQLLEVRDATRDPRFEDNELVTGNAHLRYYAGEPLRLDGARVGTLCVLDTVPRQLTDRQLDALRALAQATCELLRDRQRHSGFDLERRRLLDFALASGDWMWETDASLRTTWISGAFDSLTGQSADTLIGQPIADGLLLDGLGAPLPEGDTLHALLKRGERFSRVLAELSSARGRLVISYSGVPVHDGKGELTGWRGTARDMSDRIEAARAQRAKDILLQQLSANAPGVLFQFRRDPDGRGQFQFVNQAMTDLIGVSHDALMASTGHFLAAIHPDDRAAFNAMVASHEASLLPLRHEYRVVHPDGTQRWVESSASPERLADGSVIWRGLASDITERKTFELELRASEERWAIAADATGMGIAQVDFTTGLLTLDARACANHGLPHPHPPLSVNDWIGAVHPDEQAAARAALQHAIDHSGRLDARFRFRCPDGGEPWLEIVARVKRDAQGHALSLIGTCRDVTEPMVVDVLRRDKETAERASRAKSEFLSRVSHELRTPLNGILGFAQLMQLDRDHALTDEQQRRLEGVQRSGQHLLALVNDMLDIARIEQSDLAQRLQPVHLADAVDGCLVMIQPLAATHGVSFRVEVCKRCWVRAELRALEQVVMNLLSNAIKYNRAGGVVHLSLGLDGERAVLRVRDEGAGLSESQQAQLFQPFNRLGAERRRIDGNGLGLVIARQLTVAMNGTLNVTSPPGEGCTFELALRVSEPPSGEVPSAPATLDDEPAAAGPRRELLYIEDEPLNVLLMQEVFRGNDRWTLHIAPDGAQGLHLARALKPDLLLIDINLPDMTGITVVRQLREDPATATLHCIALSADAMHEQIETARAAGFDDYWTKPIDVARVMRLLAGPLVRQ